jgi:anti-sigma regulatory factor (Ser/Thr protein kinase)
MKTCVAHRLKNDLGETARLGPWVESFAQSAGLSSSVQNAVDLSLVEWVTNIISYGYEDRGEHWIAVRLEAGDGQVRLEVEDDGREFNPLQHPPVDTTEPLESRPVGGLGIHMIRQLMDTVEYQRRSGRNLLVLTKRIKADEVP